MSVRTLTAQQPGPVLIDTELLGTDGVITVRTDPARKEAEITIRTADETGDSADAVRGADLRWDSRGTLVAHAQGKGSISGGGTFIAGDNYGVVQSVQNNYGSMVMVSGGDLNLGSSGFRFQSGATINAARGASLVEIVAVVPEGSSVIARTQSADVIAEGTLATVSASTQSGTVRACGQTEQFTASTQSGDIRLGRTDVVEAKTMSGDVTIRDFGGTAQLNSMSGDIRVHATAGGDITAKTMSGDVTVTATEQAVNDDLDVRANSMSGDVRIPQCPRQGTGPRRRRG
ncbi:DUF4097 family beta strand repeat-containing protein [Streptomyces sp. MMS24-I29]|uniref:DUF4097 family beta strand repeat-containing protein n=1 Tax=Streptomyces sp. MMS24-I29 TaxID=3351480 RepID=UPI003C7C7C39